MVSSSRILQLDNIEHVEGACYLAHLPDGLPVGDTAADPFGSGADLLENGIGLGPAHALHDSIIRTGRGRFSHWHNVVYFSTSDNSDPRANGRSYTLYSPAERQGDHHRAAAVLAALRPGYSPSEAYAAIEQSLALLYPDAKIGEDCKAFWQDRGFLTDFQRLAGNNFRALERKYTVYGLIRSLNRVPGDIAECGAYNGSTAYFLALATQQAGLSRNVILYDSFEGLSRPRAEDGSYWKAGDLAVSEDSARQNLDGFPNVHFRRGWIPERFEEDAARQFCFVHIDVDLYQPTLDSARFFYPRLQPGGMLVCDDYGFTNCPGAMKAMDEFFADKPEHIISLPTGQGLVIKV